MDAFLMCMIIALIILCNIQIIYGPFMFMEEINIEDGIGRLHPEGFNKLNQYKIYVKNGVYKFYFKNPEYGRYKPSLFKYTGYADKYNNHHFVEVKGASGKYKYDIYIRVYGYKYDMSYFTEEGDELLKIIAAPEYAL